MNQFEHLPYRPCVGIMLINQDGFIWVGERIDTPSAWQMPQGGIDKGEEPEEAALRELEEETGLKPEDVSILQSTPDWIHYDLPDERIPLFWDGKYRGQKQIWFLVRLVAPDDHIDIKTKHPEFSDWKWCHKSEIIDMAVPFKRKAYQQVLSQFDQNNNAFTRHSLETMAKAKMQQNFTVDDINWQQGKTLFTWWQQAKGDKPYPQRADFKPFDFPAIIPNVFLYDVRGTAVNPEIFIRLAGTRIVDAIGYNPTGQNLKALPSGEMIYYRVKEMLHFGNPYILHDQPLYWKTKKHVQYSVLALPLSNDVGDITSILALIDLK